MVSCLMGDSTALASAIVRCCLKNQVPDEDGEREIVELWKESNNWESWDKHLDSLIELLQQE